MIIGRRITKSIDLNTELVIVKRQRETRLTLFLSSVKYFLKGSVIDNSNPGLKYYLRCQELL